MPQVYPDFSDNRISNLVVNQLPEFVASQYPNFVLFVQAYYEWLEQSGNIINQFKNLPNYIDVDYVLENNLNNFVNEFQSMYMANLPTNMLADKAKVLKNIKSFYSSRGAPKSFEFLFRILYNTPVTVFNPGTQILKASAGKWYQPTVIRISLTATTISTNSILGNSLVLGLSNLGSMSSTSTQIYPLSYWVNATIFGQSSHASAIVQSAQINTQFNFQYNELNISNITKQFLPAETITAIGPGGVLLQGTLLGIVPNITIINPGASYNVGDPVVITGGGGANANAYISSVSSGSLTGIQISDGGSGIQQANYSVVITGSQTPASALITNVDTSGTVSPNTYILNADLLSLNYNEVVFGNANNTVVNTWNTVTYSGCGPCQIVTVMDGGSGYTGPPGLSIIENSTIANTNTYLTQYGTIGTFKIVNGGINYSVNDDIKIINITSRGVAGGGIVTSVNGSGTITSVYVALPSIDGVGTVLLSTANTIIGTNTKFTTELFANNNASYPGTGSYILVNGETHQVANIVNNNQLTVTTNFVNACANVPIRLQGFPLGGIGYAQSDMPNKINCVVNSQSGGTGAIIQGDSIIGNSGVQLTSTAGTYGLINAVTMQNFGDHYSSQPVVSFPTGNGLATGIAQIITGIFQYPGYFLNEDGMLSSRRYLENQTFYNNYTYTLTSPISVQAYQSLVKNLLHPIGSNMVGITSILEQTPYRNANSGITTYITITSIPTAVLDINFILNSSTLSGAAAGDILGINFILGFSTPG